MKALVVALALIGCKSSEKAPPPVATEPALPVAADAPPPPRELVIEVRSMYSDARTKTFIYATEAGWRRDTLEPFTLDAATGADWKALHEVLKSKTDAFVTASQHGKLPIERIGIYLYPSGAVPDLKKSKGDPGTTAIAFYGNVMVVGTWRFCFGGHLGTGPNLRKCIDETEPASPTMYDLERPMGP